MRYFKKVEGNRIYLSPINIDDAPNYVKWLSDFETSVNLSCSHSIISIDSEKNILERLISDNNNFAIIESKNDKLIGNCGFLNVNNLNRSAEIGIFIGDKNYWNKGYGTEAIKLLLDFGFNIRNFNNIMLIVMEYNKRAFKCYKKCGFKVIGERREAVIFGNKKYGKIYMDILASEFKSSLVDNYIKEENMIKDF
ncbi:GNAT family N-acetyltransferase [Abyssisolibacter fermentans]|uniref:GNAT family N-acetyltransferase n=1 Tax=Abyssisolibacter fermentans TaxID=1766203 RepID=UPI0008353320|nr:GNAT family protein [Abyssisolibacter fermentans]